MYRSVLFIFLLCFACYLPFSRQPDYFDSEFTDGTVTQLAQNGQKVVRYKLDGQKQSYDLPIDMDSKAGEKVKIIYRTGKPEMAAVYRFWGYWLSWKELAALVIGYVLLLELAKAITHNPHPDAVKELEEEEKKPKIRKPKYTSF